MDLIVLILVLLLTGLVVGALARIALPGPDPMPIWETVALGLAGTLIAGVAVHLVTGSDGAGIVLSVLVSTLLLWGRRRARGERVQPYNHKE